MASFASLLRANRKARPHGLSKSRRRASIEPLENRLVLSASVTLTNTDQLQLLGTSGNTADVTYNSGSGTYTITGNSAITVTNDSGTGLTSTGTGTDTITVSPGTSTVAGLTFNSTGAGNTYDIESVGAATTVENTSGVTGADTVNVGSLSSHVVSGIVAPVTVSYTGTTTANLTVDDSGDSLPTSPIVASSGITSLAPADIDTTGPSISTLTIDGGTGVNNIAVNGDLPGAATTINSGPANDLVSVLGTGLATGTPTTSLAIAGGTGINTLRVNATGTTANVATPGTVTFGTGASFTYTGFSYVQDLEVNHAPVITPAGSISATTNVPLTGVTVATFTDSDTIENAGDYVATINWGDGSTSPGTIVATAVPGTYDITGSHTYTGAGPYAVAVTLTDRGGTFNTTVGGIPVATVLPALPAATGAAVDVSPGTLTGTAGSTITAIAGTQLALVTVATFTDGANTLPAGSYTATIDWGDGTSPTLGTITGSGVYTVKGSHTYGQTGAYPVQVVISGDNQQITVTELTNATVTNPTITAGSALTETAGTATGTVMLATISGTSDFAGYSATVNWGDGSTTTAATIGTITGVVTSAGHIYGNPGVYTETLTVTDAQGYVVTTTTTPVQTAFTVNGLTVTPSTTIAPAAGIATGPLVVGTVTGTPMPDPKAYTAVVTWGDGATTDSQITFTGSVFDIPTGGHTYAQGGGYTVGIAVYDAQGYLVGSTATAINVGVTLTGTRLSPQTDSGISQNDAITNVATPTFAGSVNPGTTVEIFASPAGSTSFPGTLVASGVGDGSGVYTATNYSTLADGIYNMTAEAINTSTKTVLAAQSFGSLTVETQGPVVSSVAFNRFDATATITLTEPNGLDDLDYASITNSAFYHLSASPLSSKVHVPKVILPTSITVTPGATPNTDVVSVVFYRGRPIRGGLFTLTIDSGNNDDGVQDVAGNALDGNFYGTFPSGDGLPGGDFKALIPAFHKLVLPAEPFLDGYVPPVSTPGTQPTSTLGAAGDVTSARQAELLKRAAQWPDYAGVPSARVATAIHKIAVHDLALDSLLHKASGKS
jgi:hypothetical protein